MKLDPKESPLSLGSLVAQLFEHHGERKAAGILRFIIAARLVAFTPPARRH